MTDNEEMTYEKAFKQLLKETQKDYAKSYNQFTDYGSENPGHDLLTLRIIVEKMQNLQKQIDSSKTNASTTDINQLRL